MVDDRLRSYPHWLASRNLANEASDESVEALVQAVRGRYELPRRWYRLKARLLGRRPARGLRPDGRGHRRRRDDRLVRREGHGARLVRRLRARAGRRRARVLRRPPDRRAGAAGQARRRVLLLHGPERGAVRDAQLHGAPPRRADARARARPRRARGARAPPGRVPLRDAADAGRDRERVRRDARVRPAARGGADAGVAARAAGGEHRGLDRDGLPPGRDEPLRAPRPHRRGASRASSRSTGSASCGRSRRRSCSATPSR